MRNSSRRAFTTRVVVLRAGVSTVMAMPLYGWQWPRLGVSMR